MSVVGNTFSNSSAQQIVLGEAIGRVTGGRLGTVDETNGHGHGGGHHGGSSAENEQAVPETSPEERARQVAQLARTFSHQSQNKAPPSPLANRRGSLYRTITGQSHTVDHAKVFEYESGSDLDPYSTSFDAKKWTKSIAHMSRADTPARSAGIAYRNLSVHGYGSDADYQKTVSNLPVSWASSAVDFMLGRKQRVQILNSMEGVLEAGEMLVVLGPPGRCVCPRKNVS